MSDALRIPNEFLAVLRVESEWYQYLIVVARMSLILDILGIGPWAVDFIAVARLVILQENASLVLRSVSSLVTAALTPALKLYVLICSISVAGPN